MTIPPSLSYTAEHEWLDLDGTVATVGITAYAAEALGDIVFIDLPAIGSVLASGQPCGEIESTKSVSDIYAPCDGEVVGVNTALVDDPGLVNTDPFQAGWLYRMNVTGPIELLDAAAYESLIRGE